jgi:chemotaxis protein CheX
MNTTTSPLIDEIGDMLNSSISEVFTTMFQMAVQPSAPTDIRGGEEALVAGSVGFVGDVNGIVYIYVKASFARTLAGRMLGMPEAEIEGDEMVNDVIGELSNMIVGAVKSRLCDTGAACKLTIPSIVRGTNLRAEPTGTSECRFLSFACEQELILVEFLMKPST